MYEMSIRLNKRLATFGAATAHAARWQAACAISMLLITTINPVCADPAPKDVKAYFAAVPTAVFDKTTDGLDEDSRMILLELGRTEDWIFRRINAGKAVLTAVHPSSVVTMRLMSFGRPVLQIHIQNEKNESFSYWTFDAIGKPLKAHQPSAAMRIAAAAQHDLEEEGHASAAGLRNPLAGVPTEVVAHVEALETCRDLAEAARVERSAIDAAEQAMRLKQLQCDKSRVMAADIRRNHARLPMVSAMLNRASKVVNR